MPSRRLRAIPSTPHRIRSAPAEPADDTRPQSAAATARKTEPDEGLCALPGVAVGKRLSDDPSEPTVHVRAWWHRPL